MCSHRYNSADARLRRTPCGVAPAYHNRCGERQFACARPGWLARRAVEGAITWFDRRRCERRGARRWRCAPLVLLAALACDVVRRPRSLPGRRRHAVSAGATTTAATAGRISTSRSSPTGRTSPRRRSPSAAASCSSKAATPTSSTTTARPASARTRRPEALFRVGVLADWFELRLALHLPRGDDQRDGRRPLDDQRQRRLVPRHEVRADRPGGHPARDGARAADARAERRRASITAGETLPGVNWLYGWDVTEFISTGGPTQANRRLDDETGEPYVEFSQSWTINYSLADRLGALHGVVLLRPGRRRHEPQRELLRRRVHISRRPTTCSSTSAAGVGLNDAAADMFAGVGLSIRSCGSPAT